MEINGIDISEFQGRLTDLDFERIKDSGVEFIMIRCGFSTYSRTKRKYVDSYFERNYALAKRFNIPVGAYYYSTATTIDEAIDEARFVAELTQGKRFEYPLAIDTEDNHDINDPDNAPESQASIGRNRLTAVIRAFCEELESFDKYVSIYASTDWFYDRLILSELRSYDKWVAQWSNTIDFDEEYGMWQYSSRGRISGIDGYVDLDRAYRDYPRIMQEYGLNGFTREDEEPSNPTLCTRIRDFFNNLFNCDE